MGGIGIEFRLGLLLKGEIRAVAALPLLSGEWFFLPPPLASGEAVLPLGRCGRSSQANPIIVIIQAVRIGGEGVEVCLSVLLVGEI
jgi:hypothetical protein